MWVGGVRVAVIDEDGRLLLVRQRHEGREIWMLPGGAIEDGEDAAAAAVREVFEETGLRIKPGRLIWHVEEASPSRGQRFVNYFLAESYEGTAALGSDPEFDADSQLLDGLGFFARQDVAALESVYPESIKSLLWEIIDSGHNPDVFKLRGQI
ncbi:MAG: NUDIX hydrolase [Clostridiales Family XIII bacterium]|jgi:8-oxo-dGTP pyrophosphatase MutT (NUDIX family)|nr:NUDIX hydrolase [Clostridiales Family XIII bacterium]